MAEATSTKEGTVEEIDLSGFFERGGWAGNPFGSFASFVEKKNDAYELSAQGLGKLNGLHPDQKQNIIDMGNALGNYLFSMGDEFSACKLLGDTGVWKDVIGTPEVPSLIAQKRAKEQSQRKANGPYTLFYHLALIEIGRKILKPANFYGELPVKIVEGLFEKELEAFEARLGLDKVQRSIDAKEDILTNNPQNSPKKISELFNAIRSTPKTFDGRLKRLNAFALLVVNLHKKENFEALKRLDGLAKTKFQDAFVPEALKYQEELSLILGGNDFLHLAKLCNPNLHDKYSAALNRKQGAGSEALPEDLTPKSFQQTRTPALDPDR